MNAPATRRGTVSAHFVTLALPVVSSAPCPCQLETQRSCGPPVQMFKIVRHIAKFVLFLVALTIAGSAIGCEWFPESTFELASESRLPKWITLPPELTRAGVSLTMSYYTKPWGSDVTFILQDAKGQIRTKIGGEGEKLRAFPTETSSAWIPSWLSLVRTNHCKRHN